MQKNCSIFVTGATGFIGRALLPHLLGEFPSVRCAVRSQCSLPCDSFQVGRIDGSTDWAEGLLGIDAVVHLAGFAHVNRPTKSDLALMRRTNVDGTANLAQQAAQAGIQQFVFVSSIGAVCEQAEQIVDLQTACHPTTAYGKSKLEAENVVIKASEESGMAWTIIRPPLVYGPGNPGNMARLLKLIRSGFPLPLASVRNRRSFLYVENLTDLIAKCLGNPKAVGKVFLSSDGEDVSTPELIRAIGRASSGVEHGARGMEQGALSGEHGGRSGDSVGDRKTSHSVGRHGDLSPLRSGSRHSARLFHFPPSLLEAAGMLPGLGALRKLTSSLYVDSEPTLRDLGWSPPFTMEEGLRRTLASR